MEVFMKKIMLTIIAGSLMAGSSAFAGSAMVPWKDVGVDFSLSKGVIGQYGSDTKRGYYVMEMAHTRGTKHYATGNFTTAIYVADADDPGNITSTGDFKVTYPGGDAADFQSEENVFPAATWKTN